MKAHLEEHAGCGCVAPVMHLAAPVGFVFAFMNFCICVQTVQHRAAHIGHVFCICIDNQMTTEFLYLIAVTANNNNEIIRRST